MDAGWWVKQTWRDIQAFGIVSGIRNLKRMVIKDHCVIHIPGISPIVIRPDDSDYNTVFQVFGKKEYHVAVLTVQDRLNEFCQQILKRGRTPLIIDAGANIGAATLWFENLYPAAFVVAVEPEPSNAEILRLNVAGHDRVKVVEAALGATPGKAAVAANRKSWAATTKRSENGCPIVTVDDIQASVPDCELFLLKIDIEGFEADLFASHTHWIEKCCAVFIEPHDWLFPGQSTSESFQNAMSHSKFEVFINSENLLYVRSTLLP